MPTFDIGDPQIRAVSSSHRGASLISTFSARVAVAVISLFFCTCKESLPPYQPPTLLFDGSLEPFYSLTAKENALHIVFRVRNTFDETLEGEGFFTGQVQLVALRDPTVTKTLTLTAANIISARGYNPNFGTLRIDPGDSIVFDAIWDLSQRPLLGDKGEDWSKVFFNLQPEPGCGMREKSEPEDFAVQGSIQIFAVGSPVTGKEAIFRFCLINAWVNPRDCPPVGSPCNMIISSGK